MMKILIVDDNPIYVALLKNKLGEIKIPIKIVGHAATITTTLKMINEQNPDVLILDIDLETETIFELFEHIDYRDYEIIFATGFDKYAVSAFDVEAIGYLVKPVITSQLEKFLLIAQNNLKARNEGPLPINREAKPKKQTISNDIISVPSETGFDIVPINKIQRCEAINATTHIFMDDGKKLVSSYNLGKFSDLLIDKGFYVVHRSHIVNLSFVKKYLRSGSIIMNDSTEIPLSKTNRQEFISIFTAIEKLN
jgi:two-component system LytT family response regulator